MKAILLIFAFIFSLCTANTVINIYNNPKGFCGANHHNLSVLNLNVTNDADRYVVFTLKQMLILKPGEDFLVRLVSAPIYGEKISFIYEGFFYDADLVYDHNKGYYWAKTQAPKFEGQIGIHNLIWQTSSGLNITAYVEVTCSDGIFCNGPEFFAGGRCVKGRNPCDDPELIPGVICTSCICNEKFGNVSFSLISNDLHCTSCDKLGLPACNCTGKTCGTSTKCIGSCGTCTTAGEYCIDGSCQVVNSPGSCNNPFDLIQDPSILTDADFIYNGTITVYGNLTDDFPHIIPPRCNFNEESSIIYKFTLPKRSGYHIRVQGVNFSQSLDTVMEVLSADCGYLPNPVEETCSDDAQPPAAAGSSISGTLPAGDYKLLISRYAASVKGEYVITAAFFEDQCVPNCNVNNFYCGETACKYRNGTAFNCFMEPRGLGFPGDCTDDQLCRDGKCVPKNCVANCTGKVCGPDGCGGNCGECDAGSLCLRESGECKVYEQCDHLLPYCSQRCGKEEYCGTDCKCHGVNSAYFVDLSVGYTDLKDSLYIETIHFTNASCALSPDEGPCIEAAGDRKVLRLTTTVMNLGTDDFSPPQPPADYPNLFTYSECHRHYHFKEFALFYLVDPNTGKVVKNGSKRAYCLSDSNSRITAPWSPCVGVHGCTSQGLQAGWSDDYQNILDCQWIDITTVPEGVYDLYVFTNPVRVFNENSFDNQGQRVRISIPLTKLRDPRQKVEVLEDLGRTSFGFFR